jgi:uncharacterized membrane protein YoaK (UPF0700 family)
VAGYLDGAGFLMTGGYFVSFMSGNSTRLAVSLSRAATQAGFAATLVLAFVLGVVAGASLRRLAGRRPQALILGAIAAWLALSGGVAALGAPMLAAILMAAAMGAENTIFAEAGQVRFGLTYMTGTLVRIGKGLAAEVFGEARFAWAPHLLLWASLVAGAMVGAVAFAALGPMAIWLAAAAMAALAVLSQAVFPSDRIERA